MARKLSLPLSAPAEPHGSLSIPLPAFLDAEETRRRLSQQQRTSLALSPKLQEWFDKELRVRLRE